MSDGTNDRAQRTADSAGGKAAAGEAPAIDIARLADKVFRLMQDELRLERARGAAAGRRRRVD